MRKNYWIIIVFTFSTVGATSQSVSIKKDSLKIDSIKKILAQLKPTNRIESMIFLCEYYGDNLKNRNINAADSIRFYGNKILNESKPIGYKRGIAMEKMQRRRCKLGKK